MPFRDRLHDLSEKLKETKLRDAKIQATHLKNQLGKAGNLFNPNHRVPGALLHAMDDVAVTDNKRTAIAQAHRFQSFAPERTGNLVKWYVDGRDYFHAVSVALDNAKEVIYIADWWLSPELFLRRPPFFNQEYRLDQILKRRAEAGVKIYVNVYREVEAALTCNSEHTKKVLQNLCPDGSPGAGNIRIMRHPDHNMLENMGDMTFYWAHHEKFIIVDYELAFIGGLDLCFGRWDNNQHPLSDVHPAGVQNEMFPGQDFNNNRIMDFQTVDDWKSNELSKADYGRMPWHDVAMGVIGECVYDIAEHFILRWNHVKRCPQPSMELTFDRDKYKKDPRMDYLILEGREDNEDLIMVQRPKHPVGDYITHPLTPLQNRVWSSTPQGSVKAQVVRSSGDWSSGILTEHSIQNAYIELIENAQHYVYIENQFFITATGEDQAPVTNTIGRAIVNACVKAGKEGRKFRVIIMIPAIPGFAGDLREKAASGTRCIMDFQYKSIARGEQSICGQIAKAGVDPKNHIFVFNLRSYDRLNKTAAIIKQEELSGVKYQDVQRAQAEEIMGSEVNETQYPGKKKDKEDVSGDVGREEIIDKKRRFEAAREGAGHHPDKPGHTADTIASTAMLDGGKVEDAAWDGTPDEEKLNYVQEELYIHAKLLIVDDRFVICGSANINDRSQRGDHDSELALVMEDTRTIESTMNGQPYQAGWHAATLRRYLWREHLGLLHAQSLDATNDANAQPPGPIPNDPIEGKEYELVADPLGEELWDLWTSRATRNTELYRQVFRADPDDHIHTLEDYQNFLPKSGVKQGHIFDQFAPAHDIQERLDEIKGHLVWMPLEFLDQAAMAEDYLQVNAMTIEVYT